jgi:hypothetical protein
MRRRHLPAALLVLLLLAAPAAASDSSLSGYADRGGETQSGVADPGRPAGAAVRSNEGGVAAARRDARAQPSSGTLGLPFTGYDALLFAGVGATLLGLGFTLRLLVGRAARGPS